MNRLACTAALACLAIAAPLRAQQANPEPKTAEPKVQHIVIEDEGTRIEELRVRGATQRITVTPKVGTKKSYEILPADASREDFEAAGATRGTAGKRVWHVLSF